MEYVRLLLIDLSNGKYNDHIPRIAHLRNDEEKRKIDKYLYHLELLKNEGFIDYEIDVDFLAHHFFKTTQINVERKRLFRFYRK